MKYLVMIYGNQADYESMNGQAAPGHPAWTQAELGAMFQYMETLNKELIESGEMVDGQGLSEPRQAVVITSGADGAPVVSDGPFGETKEVLAGYWVLDCADVERVTEIAKRVHACPVPEGAPRSDVVIRPIMEAPTGA
ncbi:YciI family protein [Streptomyces sp. NPDC005813]|uniref:YciI family protein n=1 Tax=Streptomyces sp. NPDC005813 TaxID=3155592 RepID=UPI00340E5BC6